MANNVLVNVKSDFDLAVFADRLAKTYVNKGYTVNVLNVNGTTALTVEKGTSGATHLLGMSESVRVNCILTNDLLTVSFSDEAWTNKIVAVIVGWIICCIPFITGIVGCVRQYSLPTNIAQDVQMIVAGM